MTLDISDFYSRIYHHRVENDLLDIDSTSNRARQARKILQSFSTGVSYGLPVGGPAARILAEMVLSSVDSLLLTQRPRIVFARYADDYRFFVNDLEDAHYAIGYLAEKLQRNEGLSLQRSKTRIMTAREYLSSLRSPDPLPGSADKFLSLHLYYDPYSMTAEEDYDRLKDQLSQFDVLGLLREELSKGRVDAALTRRLVGAVRHMLPVPKEQAIRSLIENLDTLAPVLPHVLRAIRDSIDDLSDSAQSDIHSSLRELVESENYLSRVDVNLAYIVRVLARRRSPESERLLARLFSAPHGYAGFPAPNIQRDIVLIMGKWNANYWLRDQKWHYQTMHPWVQRAFLIASQSLGDEGNHWRQSIQRGLTGLDTLALQCSQDKAKQGKWEVPI